MKKQTEWTKRNLRKMLVQTVGAIDRLIDARDNWACDRWTPADDEQLAREYKKLREYNEIARTLVDS